MIPWWLSSIVANVAIAAIEYLNRAGGYDSFWSAVLRTGPLIVVAQWGLFGAWNHAPSFLLAWAVFTAGNCVIRMASSHYMVGERLNIWTIAGAALIMGGAYVINTIGRPAAE